jgi:hypothetical protein
MLPEPSLIAIYALGLWDGFFASIGVTALLAATPALVGRENLMQAGAITMLTVRLGSVISPMVGAAAGYGQRGVELRPGGGGDVYHHLNVAAFTGSAATTTAA